jgi:hypothetical protein
MRWTRYCRLTSGTQRTAKSCGPDASTLVSSGRQCSRIAPVTETTKPDLRGEHEGNRQTIARGMPDCFGKPVVTNSCAFFVAREAAGEPIARHSLRPLNLARVKDFQNPDARAPRECGVVLMSCRHCEERELRSNPESLRGGFWIASLALAMPHRLGIFDVNSFRCRADQRARSQASGRMRISFALLMMQVSCNSRANAIAGYRKQVCCCREGVVALNESNELTLFVTIDTTKDSSKRLTRRILWKRWRAATSCAPAISSCDELELLTKIHRTDRLQALEMSNGRQ